MQPHRLLREMDGGESQEVADALEKWALGALSRAAMHPADTPDGGLGFHNVRSTDAEWIPGKTATQRRFYSEKKNSSGRTT